MTSSTRSRACRGRQAEHHAVQDDVVARRHLLVEAHAQLDERRYAPGDLDAAAVQAVDPRQALQHLRELIVEAVRIGKLHTRNPLHRTIRDLIVRQLQDSSSVPVFVVLPQRCTSAGRCAGDDGGAGGRPIVGRVTADAGASVRTIERPFRRDVGLSFETWRRQARLMKAIELLVAGDAVKEVAYEVGYRQPSAFVEMFRHTMGTTAKTWTSALIASRRSA